MNGCVPAVVFGAYDAKIANICKYIINETEVNSQVMIPLILRAATKVTDLELIPDEQLSLKRRIPYPSEILLEAIHESGLQESIPIEVIYIPASFSNAVVPLTLNIAATDYYLDVIAHELDLNEASDLLISRTIGKSSSEMRMYSPAPKKQFLDTFSKWKVEQTIHFEGPSNVRASYIVGQEVYGDVILASVGYTWRSSELWHEAVSLRSYYRMLINMIPSGIYKISREALLTAKLPSSFTTKGNWRGSLPKDILCAFCRLHHLSEPVFSTQSKLLVSSLDIPGSCKKLKVTQLSKEEEQESGLSTAQGNTEESVEVFNCEVKLHSKKQELILQCSPHDLHRRQTDAMNSTSLKVLSWLTIVFEEPDKSMDKLTTMAETFEICFLHQFFFNTLCSSIRNVWGVRSKACSVNSEGDEVFLIDLGGKNTGGTPSNGSLACITYTVSLFREDACVKESLESCEEFEFELGNEGVLPHLESAVAQMAVGQSSYFRVDLPPDDFILAAAGDTAATLSLLSTRRCKLEYCVTLLRVTEPLEERMEQALFSPPLSKQRVEFAVKQIKESSALSLVDFGCGSGSLLDSLLSYPTSLEKVVGVDISQKSLARAAKSLHSKLNKLLDSKDPSNKIKYAVLYDGSITKFDSRLRGYDIATCLEVIEHMEEKDACIFGDVALSLFCPKILIVSTPNYEYNVILQRSSTCHGQEDGDTQEAAQAACKFRNHDHKFEWNRAEFNQWASELAARHNYGVEFSGVGGAGDVEPGFASQIAIFRRMHEEDIPSNIESVAEATNESSSPFSTIWEWNREDQECNEKHQ
ncbi:small RNA 2'-O-methyltransferase isoform X2 [Andrographis paniculata]|nr:small RNA 2'-O-methyltransferase isoform X2 [Andrographis paniculata]